MTKAKRTPRKAPSKSKPDLSDWSGMVPAELRPMDPRVLRTGNELVAFARRLSRKGPALADLLRASVETPFPERFHPQTGDGFAVFALLTTIADALRGWGSWEPIRDAYRALHTTRLDDSERIARALDACERVRDRWVAARKKPRPAAVKEGDHNRAVQRSLERIASTLVLALRELHPAFTSLSEAQVFKIMDRLDSGSGRKKFRADQLLEDLSKAAGAWFFEAETLRKKRATARRK